MEVETAMGVSSDAERPAALGADLPSAWAETSESIFSFVVVVPGNGAIVEDSAHADCLPPGFS